MTRGRLIFPLVARIARLDPVATVADPDGAGPLESGLDDEFRETVAEVSASAGSEPGSSSRQEVLVDVLAQVEPADVERLQAGLTGAAPSSTLELVLHYSELETKGLVQADGTPALKIGDRLAELRDLRSGALVETFRDPPGMYATSVRPAWGWLDRRRNLLLMTFASRDLSTRA